MSAALFSRSALFTVFYLILIAGACLQLGGCATQPGQLGLQNYSSGSSTDTSRRARIVRTALSMLGQTYHFGGASPGGFDCSGLVYYSYARAGFKIPRTTIAQYGKTRPVAPDKLMPGDLLFFKINKRGVSHVAIYQGDGTFIHAPRTGKKVARERISRPYWSTRLVRAGRLIV